MHHRKVHYSPSVKIVAPPKTEEQKKFEILIVNINRDFSEIGEIMNRAMAEAIQAMNAFVRIYNQGIPPGFLKNDPINRKTPPK